jgi:hypothetical protein
MIVRRKHLRWTLRRSHQILRTTKRTRRSALHRRQSDDRHTRVELASILRWVIVEQDCIEVSIVLTGKPKLVTSTAWCWDRELRCHTETRCRTKISQLQHTCPFTSGERTCHREYKALLLIYQRFDCIAQPLTTRFPEGFASFELTWNLAQEAQRIWTPIDCRTGSYRFSSAERTGDEHEPYQRGAMQKTQEE